MKLCTARILIITLLGLIQFKALSAPDTMPGSFDEHIRTLQVKHSANEFAPPVIVLGTDDKLTFSFDHLSDDRAYFRYRFIHCNANWQPSSLVDSEIIDGFNEGIVNDFDYSRGTTVNYVNYRFTIPDGNMRPLVSGNYLLALYEESNPDKILAQWRFMVSEQVGRIGVELSSRTDIDYNQGHQQLAITVDTERNDVEDPFNDLTVMVQQNGRLDNEVALRHPMRMSGRKAIYEHSAPLVFEAGNEYRRFETVSLDYPGMHVDNTEYIHPYFHTTLQTDMPRAQEIYLYDSTQRGRFKIREYDSDDADTNADYVVVHFSLSNDELPGTMIFIDGDLTSRRFDESSRMTFNHATGRYEKALLLKQGSYNYQYLSVAPGDRKGHATTIEGDKFQTVNEYLIKVYTRRPGDRYDRLIGVSSIVNNS